MFVNEDYSNYKYLISASDNFVVLTNVRQVNADWQNPRTIDIIYQYINPSFLTIESERTYTSTASFSQIDITNDFFSRADSLDLIKVQVILIFMILFFINGLTRFVKKGGVFFGS